MYCSVIWFPLAAVGGMARVQRFMSNSSLILNPLSAMTKSKGSSRSKKPLSVTINLFDDLPPYAGDIHDTAPFGVMQTITLKCCMVLVVTPKQCLVFQRRSLYSQ